MNQKVVKKAKEKGIEIYLKFYCCNQLNLPSSSYTLEINPEFDNRTKIAIAVALVLSEDTLISQMDWIKQTVEIAIVWRESQASQAKSKILTDNDGQDPTTQCTSSRSYVYSNYI